MKLDFNIDLIGLEGEALKDQNGSTSKLNHILAKALVTGGGKENILKFFDWGLKLQNGGILDLDRTDQKLFKTTIENFEFMTILAKARILEVMENRKEESTKTEE